MDTVTRQEYKYLCALLIECHHYISRNDLELLKLTYEKDINSKRRLSRVKNLKDLLTLLEKRDCLSENNISVLEDIAKIIKSPQAFLSEINNRRNPNNIATSVINVVESRLPKTVEELVYELIINELGSKWVDFARALNIRESRLDQLRMLYPTHEESCIKEVLSDHKRNAHEREWKHQLLDALTEARRNDLKKEIEKIYMRYS